MSYAYTNKFLKVFATVFDFCGSILFFWIPKNRKIKDNEVNKILIVKLDQLGDCFLMTPIFEYLKNKFPKSQIDLVCQENARPIFDNNPFISNIITFNYWRMYRGKNPEKFKDFLRLIKKLRKEKYDLFIDPRGESFMALLGFKIGAKYRLGFEKEEIGGFLYTHPLRYDRTKYEAEKYKIILDKLGIKVNLWRPKIYLNEEEIKKTADFIKDNFYKPIIALHIGAGLPYKVWPTENFAKLIKKINEINGNYEFALLGGGSDRNYAQKILEVGFSNVKDLTGKLSIRETYYFISKTKIFIGNDSVLAHFAGALNIPTIELMNNAVDKNRWGAAGEKVKILVGLDKNHICRYDKCMYPCPNMKAIQVADVLALVNQFL